MNRLIACGIVGALIAGCGDSLEVDNVNPTGSVGGIVVDAVTRQPLADVQVSVLAGGRSFDPKPTGADGTFSFGGVPAGEVLVWFDAPDGYQDAMLRGTLSNAAGEFPTGNATLTLGPIGVIPLNQTFALRVLDQHGQPAGGYPVTLQTFAQYVDMASGAASGRGETLRTVTTDGNGYATFSGFPNYFALGPSVNDAAVVLLPPRDADGDGILEYAGGDRLLAMRSLGDPTPDVILDAGYTAQLRVRASTVAQLAGAGGSFPTAAVVGISERIHVTFNLPVLDEIQVRVRDEYGNPVANQPSTSVRDDTLTIDFGGAPLLPGNEYNLDLHAIAAVGERLVTGDFAAPFFTRAISDTVTVTGISRDPASQLVQITFSEPIGLGNNANNGLGGGNCVLYFNADLGGTGNIGDFSGELGAGSCHIDFYSNEPNPLGPAGLSGYTRHWYFYAPPASGGGALPSNTRVHLLFDRVHDAVYRIERPDGRPVANFTETTSVPLP